MAPLVRTGGSRHTGLAAPPHRNIQVDEGILYKKRGIGMFVAEGAKENILNRRRNEFYDHYVKKLLEEAASIGLDKNEVIKLIQSADK